MSEELVIVSAAGDVTATDLAQALLAVAEHPEQVHWRPRQGGFEVPQSVASRYAATLPGEKADDEPAKPPKGRRTKAKAAPQNEPPPAVGEPPANEPPATVEDGSGVDNTVNADTGLDQTAGGGTDA